MLATLQISHDLKAWMEKSGDGNTCNLRHRDYKLATLTFGDISGIEGHLSIHVALSCIFTGVNETGPFDLTGLLFSIQDVPGDRNCRLHAILDASNIYGQKADIGSAMPTTLVGLRAELVQFLKERRSNIEHCIVNIFGPRRPRAVIWNDCNTMRRDAGFRRETVSFDSFCRNITKDGLNTHWLGTRFGDMEARILSRSLIVSIAVLHVLHGRYYGNVLVHIISYGPIPWKGHLLGV